MINFLCQIRKKGLKSAEMLDGLRLTGYFLESRALAAKGRKMPQAALRLRKILSSSRDLIAGSQASCSEEEMRPERIAETVL